MSLSDYLVKSKSYGRPVIYMEVDLKNKELPTGRMGSCVAELAKECGVTENAIRSRMSHAKHSGERCRFVRVVL